MLHLRQATSLMAANQNQSPGNVWRADGTSGMGAKNPPGFWSPKTIGRFHRRRMLSRRARASHNSRCQRITFL